MAWRFCASSSSCWRSSRRLRDLAPARARHRPAPRRPARGAARDTRADHLIHGAPLRNAASARFSSALRRLRSGPAASMACGWLESVSTAFRARASSGLRRGVEAQPARSAPAAATATRWLVGLSHGGLLLLLILTGTVRAGTGSSGGCRALLQLLLQRVKAASHLLRPTALPCRSRRARSPDPRRPPLYRRDASALSYLPPDSAV